MKSSTYFFSSLCMMLLLSCQKDNDFSIVTNTVDDSHLRSFLYAFFDKSATRTALDNYFGDVKWNPNDSIVVFTDSNASLGVKYTLVKLSGDTAEFQSDSVLNSSMYWALSPYDSTAIFDNSQHRVNTSIPSTQFASTTLHSFDPKSFLAVGCSDTINIGFRNVCGGVRFSLMNDNINKVVFSTNNNETLAGAVSISISKDDYPEATLTGNQSNSITLECTDGCFEPNTYYYITSLPTELLEGFKFEFYNGSQLIANTSCLAPLEIKRSTFSTINMADDPESVKKIIFGKDLSNDGLDIANCYIVNEAGHYSIPVMNGNGSVQINQVSVIWETQNSCDQITENSVIENVALKNNKIYFNTPDDIVDGNALIAGNMNGIIVWSWHIWVCKGFNPDDSKQPYGTDGYLMDRNLGALSAQVGDDKAFGLFYQWGRKDPFIGACKSSDGNSYELMKSTHSYLVENTFEVDGNSLEAASSLAYSIKNPNSFLTCEISQSEWQDWIGNERDNELWGDSKTIYDPCPAGWMIPPVEEYNNNSLWDGSKLKSNYKDQGISYTLSNSQSSWLPVCGYLDAGTGTLVRPGYVGYYWYSTPEPWTSQALAIIYDDTENKYSMTPKNMGKTRGEAHSVRCIKE